MYEGYHLLSIRDFKAGGELLLDALSTFTATELLSYNEFVTLTVLANTLSLPRTELKKKVGVDERRFVESAVTEKCFQFPDHRLA